MIVLKKWIVQLNKLLQRAEGKWEMFTGSIKYTFQPQNQWYISIFRQVAVLDKIYFQLLTLAE